MARASWNGSVLASDLVQTAAEDVALMTGPRHWTVNGVRVKVQPSDLAIPLRRFQVKVGIAVPMSLLLEQRL